MVTNQLGGLMLITGLLLNIFFVSSLGYIPFTLFILSAFALLIPFLNFLHWIALSRLLVCLTPPLLILASSVLIKLNQPEKVELYQYVSPRFVIFGFVLIPLALFTRKELNLSIFCIFIILMAGVIFDEVHGYFGVSYQQLGLSPKRGFLIVVDYIILLIVIFASVLFLLYNSYKYEMINAKLIKETQLKNQDLENNALHLKKALQELEEKRTQEQELQWVNDKVIFFSELINQFSEENALAESVLSHLLKETQAQFGALFLLNEQKSEKVLEMLACFAGDRKRFSKKEVYPGEGFIGQVFLDKQIKIISSLPEDYLVIHSGLIEATPQELLLIPILDQKNALGVIEVASFREFEKKHLDLVQRIASLLSTAFLKIRFNNLMQYRLTNLIKKETALRNNLN